MEVVKGPMDELNWKLLLRNPEKESKRKINIIKNIYTWSIIILLAFLAMQNYIEISMYVVLLLFFLCIPMLIFYFLKDTLVENNSTKLKRKIKRYFTGNYELISTMKKILNESIENHEKDWSSVWTKSLKDKVKAIGNLEIKYGKG